MGLTSSSMGNTLLKNNEIDSKYDYTIAIAGNPNVR